MGVLGAPLALWSVDGAYAVCRAYCRVVFFYLRVTCGLRVEVRGRVPKGEVLVAAKHQSFLDILIIFEALPRAKFIMKKELRWAPFIGLYALRIGSTPVSRGDRSKAMKAMVEHAGKAEEARQLVIYPQGTRVAPGARPPFKIGAGVLYERLGHACVPAATNAGVFWGRRSLHRRPGLAVVEFLPPIPPGLEIPVFMGRIEAEVEAASDRLMREAGFDPGPRADCWRQATSDVCPMSRNLRRRALRISAGLRPSSSARSSAIAAPTRAMVSGLSRWAPPRGLGDDAVDDAEGEQVLGGQAQSLGGLLHLLGVLPEDRGAALGRDHRVDRMLEHGDAVGGGEGDGAAGAALADDDGDERHADLQALLGRAGDRLGLAALLGALAGVGAGGVDEGDDRHARSGRRGPSGGSPCGSPRGGPCRSCGRCASGCRCPSRGR